MHVRGSWFDKQQINLNKNNGNTSFTPELCQSKGVKFVWAISTVAKRKDRSRSINKWNGVYKIQ